MSSSLPFSDIEIFDCCPSRLISGPIWPYKHDAAKLKTLEVGDPYTYAMQIQQQERRVGGGLFKDSYWNYWSILPSDIDLIRIYCDTAQKTGEQNDYSVFQCWARSRTTGIYLLDQCRGKWPAPKLEENFVSFWNKHKPTLYKTMGAQLTKVEDKSSGSSLIQSIKQDYMIPIDPIQRNNDKFFRAMGVIKYFASKWIHIPAEDAIVFGQNYDYSWVHDYKEEFARFTPMMTHKFDDQIDPTMDAVEDLLVFTDLTYSERAL